MSEKPTARTFQPLKPIADATLLGKVIQQGVEKALGRANILQVGAIDVGEYHVEGWTVYIWSDTLGGKNSIFISERYAGDSHPNYEIVWYKGRQEIAKTMMNVPDQRGFIERCVNGKVTPESLKR